MNRLALYEQIMQQLAQGRTQDAQQVFSQIVKHSLAEALQTDKHQTLTEIKWHSPEVVNSALDAAIYCGFEAETVWDSELLSGNELDAEEVDSLTFNDPPIQELISRQVGEHVIYEIRNAYFDGIIESPVYSETLDKVTRRHIFNVMEEPSRLEEFVTDELNFEDIEEDFEDWREGLIYFSQNKIKEKQENLENPKINQNPEAVKKLKRMIEIYQDQIARLDSESPDYNQQEAIAEYIEQETDSEAREQFQQWAERVVDDEYLDEIHDETLEEVENSYTIDDWIEDQTGSLSDFLRDYDVFVYRGDDADESTIDQIGDMIYDGWIKLNSEFDDYVSGPADETGDDPAIWHIETDPSLHGGRGAEIISPVYDSPREMLIEMFSLFKWLQSEGAESNLSTGLHVTMSMPGTQPEVNAVKMAVMLDDLYLLEKFERLGNTYTKSQLEELKRRAQEVATGSEKSIEELEKMLEHGISREKMYSINFKGTRNDEGNQLMEFRIAGNADYMGEVNKVQDAVVRYATTMQLGYDQDAYRREYATKLVRMLNKSLDLDIGEEPASTDNTVQILIQAVKELGISDSFVRNAVVRDLNRLKNYTALTMPEQSDKEKLEIYKDHILEIIYWMVESVSRYKVKNASSPGVARKLRTVLNSVGIDIVELASKIKNRRGLTHEEGISALAKLLAAPNLPDKLGVQKIRKVIRLGLGNTLLVHGSAINHVLAGEYDQIDPDEDFAVIDVSLQKHLRYLGWNNTNITDTTSEQYQNNVLPGLEDRVEDYLNELRKRLGAPVWAEPYVRPGTGDIETDLTADLSEPVEANQWYVVDHNHPPMISKFQKAGISLR